MREGCNVSVQDPSSPRKPVGLLVTLEPARKEMGLDSSAHHHGLRADYKRS